VDLSEDELAPVGQGQVVEAAHDERVPRGLLKSLATEIKKSVRAEPELVSVAVLS
jgi:hypothetical protein